MADDLTFKGGGWKKSLENFLQYREARTEFTLDKLHIVHHFPTAKIVCLVSRWEKKSCTDQIFPTPPLQEVKWFAPYNVRVLEHIPLKTDSLF